MAKSEELVPQIEEVVRHFQGLVQQIGALRQAVNVASLALDGTRTNAHIGYQLRRADTWAQDALIAAEGALELARAEPESSCASTSLLKMPMLGRRARTV